MQEILEGLTLEETSRAEMHICSGSFWQEVKLLAQEVRD